jgi:hypothetical protein
MFVICNEFRNGPEKQPTGLDGSTSACLGRGGGNNRARVGRRLFQEMVGWP